MLAPPPTGLLRRGSNNTRSVGSAGGRLMCQGAVDIVVIVDVSGSVGSAGIARAREFLVGIASHLRLGVGSDTQLIGAIQVGSQARVVVRLTDDAAVFAAGLEGLTADQWGLDLAQGLGYVDDLVREGRQHALSKVLIIADGPALRPAAAVEMAGRVAAYAQLVVLLVAPAYDQPAIDAARSWATASPPYGQRPHAPGVLLHAHGWDALARCEVAPLLAALCPVVITEDVAFTLH